MGRSNCCKALRKGAAVLLALLAVGLVPLPALAQGEERLAGGIGHEGEYKELFLLTGKPIVLTGQARVAKSLGRDNGLQVRLTYNLKNDAHQVSLTRSITLQGKEEKALGGRQRLTTLEVASFSETARVGQNRFSLRQSPFPFPASPTRPGR
jgi:hypothetical protein